MADDVNVVAGAATYTAATDDCSGAHAQIIKLAYSADGSRTLVGADANGLDVDVVRVDPGTGATNLGKAEDGGHTTGDVGVMPLAVRNDAAAGFGGTDLDYVPLTSDNNGNQNVVVRRGTVRIAVSSAGLTTSTTAYTAGDQVGTQFTLAGAARKSGGTGRIKSVTLLSDADIVGAYDVVFTRASITLASDNAAYAISDTDSLNVVGIVQMAGAFDIGNNRICQAYNLDMPYDCSGGTSLYAGLITRVGHTFFGATDDLTLIVFVELD